MRHGTSSLVRREIGLSLQQVAEGYRAIDEAHAITPRFARLSPAPLSELTTLCRWTHGAWWMDQAARMTQLQACELIHLLHGGVTLLPRA